jgi:PIN domain nuclease of toxin-antitoxin system
VVILLDTHFLLWAVGPPDRLSATIRSVLEDGQNEILFSAASIWEIAIKAALGRQDFLARPDGVAEAALRSGFRELPLSWQEAASVVHLPSHHRDPFDRLLVAQAIAFPARLLTVDAMLARYSELVWVVQG